MTRKYGPTFIGTIVTDPKLMWGPYRLLGQTTGRFAAMDTRLGLRDNPVHTDKTLDAVIAWCRGKMPNATLTRIE